MVRRWISDRFGWDVLPADGQMHEWLLREPAAQEAGMQAVVMIDATLYAFEAVPPWGEGTPEDARRRAV